MRGALMRMHQGPWVDESALCSEMCVSVGRIYQRFLSREEAIRDLRGATRRGEWDLEDGPPSPAIDLPQLDSDQEWWQISNETLSRAYFERIGENVTVLDYAVC